MQKNKFLNEIYEQPKALQDTLNFYLVGDGKAQLSKVVAYFKKSKHDKIVFTGMGSSFFICNAASTLLSEFQIPSQVINAGELLHYQFPIITPDTLLVCISQSGESYEIVKILEKLSPETTCIGICNEEESTLAKHSHIVLLSKAGREEMTSTKTFTSTALTAVIFSLALADQFTALSVSQIRSVINSVSDLINDFSAWLPKVMSILRHVNYIQLVSRGPSIASVQQGALMFMEGARIPASGLLSGEFRHGPMEMVKEGFLAIILAPDGVTYHQHINLAEDIQRFGGKVILICNEEPADLPSGIICIPVHCNIENLFLIPAIIPLQFVVNQLAIDKGSIPGKFGRGAKITTIE